MADEKWLPVPGFDGYYEVSDMGRFRRVMPGRGAQAMRSVSVGRRSAKGYAVVELCRADKKERFFAHQLVARAFLGGPPTAHHCVNHIDAIKTNNAVSNLEWVTRAENNAHAAELGLLRPRRGVANGRAKLTERNVMEIRALKGRATQREIAKTFGVTRTIVQRIHQGKAWKSLSTQPEDLRVRELPR